MTGNAYYERLCGAATDGKCKNVTRLTVVAHDPDVYFNPDAEAFTAAWIEEQWQATAEAIAKERRLRVASYVASGNKERFLTDTTGNRRWLPFRVTAIASPFAHPMPYAQMYAQAWALVQQGYDFWFSLDDIRAVASHVDEFMVETNEQQLLPVYFAPCAPETNGAQLLTVAEISAKLTLYGNIRKPLDVRQLGALLRKMGYTSARTSNRGTRGYIVLEKSADSINAERKMSAQSATSETPVEPIEPIEPIPF